MTILKFVNSPPQKQANCGIITHTICKLPDNIFMCIPEWITTYEPVDDVDERLFNYFRQLFRYPHGSKQEERAISQIYQILVTQKMLLSSKHDNYDDAVLKNFQWAKKSIIIITPEIINLLTAYCQNHQSETIDKINKHLNTLREKESSTKKKDPEIYRQTKNHLGTQIDNLIQELSASNDNNDHADFLAQLQSHIQRSPRIKIFNPDLIYYPENQEDNQTDNEIDNYVEEEETPARFIFKNALSAWMNKNLKHRINDLYNPKRQRKQVNIKDLNQPPEPPPKVPALVRFKRFYIQEDPHGLLASRHLNGHPECTYKILAERLILKEPPDKIRDIYRDFNITQKQEQGIYSQLQRTFWPIISSISIELGFYPEGFENAIIEDVDCTLRNCHKKVNKQPVYDAQILAQKLLPLFQPADFIFTIVVNYLNNKGHEVRVSNINLNDQKFFKIYLLIARELENQGLRKITSFDVLSYWETATIETFITELESQGHKNITYQQIKTFWDEKCRKVLGKLAISLNKEE